MAYHTLWFKTELPQEIIEIIEADIKKLDKNITDSVVGDDVRNNTHRNSKNTWIPETHWITGWLWTYVQMANRNFNYDITEFDYRSIQYTHYDVGTYYHWHPDYTLKDNDGLDRKLSITVQLSDPTDYEGGCLEFIDSSNKHYVAPKGKGTVIIFDSRVVHRVTKVRSGYRKSLVAWAVGPKWK